MAEDTQGGCLVGAKLLAHKGCDPYIPQTKQSQGTPVTSHTGSTICSAVVWTEAVVRTDRRLGNKGNLMLL